MDFVIRGDIAYSADRTAIAAKFAGGEKLL